MTAPLVHTFHENGIARITIDHPPLNILTRGLLAEFRDQVALLEGEETLRALIVDAAGKHFSAGADVAEHLPPECDAMIPEFAETMRAVHTFPTPVIAAVQGKCLGGGCELAIAADLIVAADSAVFGQPEIMLGVLPPAACALLPGRLPAGMLTEVVLTGDPVAAKEWHRVGLVNRLVSNGEVAASALDLAERIARHSAAAVRAGKRMLREGAGDRSDALARTAERYLDDLMATHDAEEGLRAFLEKREPSWTHR